MGADGTWQEEREDNREGKRVEESRTERIMKYMLQLILRKKTRKKQWKVRAAA